MSIGLSTTSLAASVDLEGSVSVPDGPDAVRDGELSLEAFAHPPLLREVLSFYFNMIFCNELEPFDGEDGVII